MKNNCYPHDIKNIFRASLWILLFTVFLLASCIPLEEGILPVELPTLTPTLEQPAPTAEVVPQEQPQTLPTEVPAVPSQDIFTVTDEKFPLINEGDWLIYLGDYTSAEKFFQARFDEPGASLETKASALLGLGRVAMLTQQNAKAIQLFDTIIQNYPASERAIEAYFFLGELYTAADDAETAARAYLQFANASPQTLPALTWEKIGNAHFKAGLYGEAINAYQSTINTLSNTDEINKIKSKIAQVYAAQGESDIAIQYYLDAFNNSENDYFRAQMNYLLGQAYLTSGQADLAYERFQANLSQYPYTHDSYSGLVALVNNGQVVDEYQRGLTDYYAKAFGVAVDAFNRYIQNTPIPERNGNVHHFKALSLLALEDYAGAVAEWQFLIDNFPTNQYFSTAWDEIAYTQWVYLKSPKLAANTYLQYCDTYPANSDVPDFLFFAARIYERFDDLLLAAQTWERIAAQYPASSQAIRSIQLAGISYYRLGHFDSAANRFNQMLETASSAVDKSAAYFWLGKIYTAQNDSANAAKAYDSAFLAAPSSYYGIRADESLLGVAPLTDTTNLNFSIDLVQERKQAIIWMRSTFGIEPTVDLQTLGSLENDPDYMKAVDYWRFGFYQESLNQFDLLRQKYVNDPVNTFRLIAVFVNHGYYRLAAFASRHILDLSTIGETNYLAAPAYFNHLRFASFYADLVTESASRYDLAPILIFSQIRQESLFESRVGSSAGAMGLMQIIPSTGQQIQQQLGFPENFNSSMLFLPVINVPMGVYYLDLQRDYFDGQLLPALAAYNAGPGNAALWLSLAQGDPDLFFEIIRFSETRTYIMNIVETRKIYQTLYQVVE